jgi:hypothetical protein
MVVTFGIIVISIQPLGRFWQEPEPSQATGMALVHCSLGKFFGVVCHCFHLALYAPTFAARCLHVPINARAPSSERWNRGREWSGNFAEMPFFSPFRDLLHAANQRHGANGFTFLPKEGMLRNFSPEKSDGFGWERTRDLGLPEASMLTTRPPKPLTYLHVITLKRGKFHGQRFSVIHAFGMWRE